MPVETKPIPLFQSIIDSPNTKDEINEALKYAEESIRVGSKSFSFAARVFGKQTRQAAFGLYAWCRYCDDQIDEASDNKQERLENLVTLTKAAFAGEKMEHPAFIAFQYVTSQYRIPIDYALELLEGMAMDVRGERYETVNDLLVYCYRVAGTVGLMMSHIMGVSSEKALLHAASLGKAMQLTNIARDVMEDFENGRVYLPLDWLEEMYVKPEEVGKPENRVKIALITKRLLAVAGVMYQSGDKGLQYLPLRESAAIAAARLVYSEIGMKVLKRHEKAWDERAYISGKRKGTLVLKGVAKAIKSIPNRIRRPWRRAQIKTIWRNVA